MKYFYPGGNLNAVLEISTIIPKIFECCPGDFDHHSKDNRMILPHINTISETQFAASDQAHHLFSHDDARRFAALELPDTGCRATLSWRSDLIEPSIFVDEVEAMVWVGVDERVAAVTYDGQVRLSLPLDSPLLTMLQYTGGVIVVCELAALVMNLDNTRMIDFPEIPEECEVLGNRLIVHFIDGTTHEFSLEE